jgi:hypothetical protein
MVLFCMPKHSNRIEGLTVHLISRATSLLALIALLVLSIPLLPQSNASAQASLSATRKLSAITAADGTVQSVLVAGARVIFLADYDESGRFDLYSAPLAGGPSIRLTAALPSGTIDDFQVSSAGLVVFATVRDSDGRPYLYSVPATGGTPLLLGPTYPTNPPPGPQPGSRLVFNLAGERTVFTVDSQRKNSFELFSVPAAGGQLTRLSQALPATDTIIPQPSWVGAFDISADDAQVVYVRRGNYFGLADSLYVVPVTGGTQTLLAANVPPDSASFAIAPNGTRVAYATETELRTVPIGGGASALIETGAYLPFTITGDSARVVYAVSGTTAATIKSAPLAGGAATTITADARYPGGGGGAFTLTPDGASVLFNDSALTALLRAPTLGGASQTVFTAAVLANTVSFTNDGTRALFVTGSYGSQAIYSYPLASGAAVRIDDPALSAGGFLDLEGVTSGGRALYIARTAATTAFRLYSVPVGGGATTTLTNDLGPNQATIYVRGSGADSTVIFTSGTTGFGGPPVWRRLYAVPADGSADARLVDQPRALVGDVASYAVSPSDERAVYLADQTTDNVRELFSVPLAGGIPTRLNAAGQTVVNFKISPVGGRVVYAALPSGEQSVTLYSVPIGGGAATALGASLGSSNADYAFTPSGARVLFRALTVSFPAASTLFSAPAAGGSAVTIANSVSRFALDPTSTRVVFLNDQLRSAPVAGGTVAELGAAGNLTALDGQLLITPDGARVIYAPANFPGLPGFVSQPITGGNTVELVPIADSPGKPIVQLSADGAYLLHGAQLPSTNQSDPLIFRIQRIPVGGGDAVTLRELSLPADSLAPAFSFAQASGGGPMVYSLSRGGPNSTVEHTLGSVPVSGGQAVTLYGPANITSTNLPYKLSDDGAQVLFIASSALYRIPAAGGTAPVKLSGANPVTAFDFAEDGALFIEGGTLNYASLNSTAVQIKRPADNAAARSFTTAGRTIVFTGVRPASSSTGETIELYAAALPNNTVFLPLTRR